MPDEKNTAPEQIGKAEIIFTEAKAYCADPSKDKLYNQKFEALCEVFNGDRRIFLHASSEKDIIESILFFKSLGLQHIVLTGSGECYNVLGFLKQQNIPVVVSRVHELPGSTDDNVFLNYELPALLQDSGIVFCLDYAGDMEAAESRNLPFTAGTAVTFGLDYEKAVQAITLNTAMILGIDDRLGSIVEGKDATFFISEGDALDMQSSQLLHAFINGRQILLDTHPYDGVHEDDRGRRSVWISRSTGSMITLLPPWPFTKMSRSNP